MDANEGGKNGNGKRLSVVRGSQRHFRGRRRGPRVLTAEQLRLERDMQTAFVALEGSDGTVPSRGIYDVRCGAHHPWRTMARRVLEAKSEGTPKERVRRIGEVFLSWIDGLYEPPRAA